jgi:MscS family membrane protein
MYLFILSDPFFDQQFLDNPVRAYVWFVCILLAGFTFKRIISKFITRQLFRLGGKYTVGVGVDKFVELQMQPFNLFVMLLIVYLAFDRLEYPYSWHLVPREVFGIKMIIFKAFAIGLTLAVTWMFLRLTDYFGLILRHRAERTLTRSDDQLVPFIRDSIKLVILFFSFLFMLGSIFEFNVASLLAGLGIGGLAVALAAKESLENLLGSITIFLDKPFVIGDLIRIGSITGHVETIGFRSTRIRTQEKTFVTLPNKKVVDDGVENLTLRNLYRARFSIGITYESNPGQLKNIIAEIKKLFEEENMIGGESSVHFDNIGTSSLDLLVQYFVKTSDPGEFIKIKERINFRLLEIVNANGASFAYPTNRVFFENMKNEMENMK